jgi:anhydro-N-acetylmuramic acid kinase
MAASDEVTMLTDIRLKDEKTIVGLMSGTSADGIDAVLVRMQGTGVGTTITIRAQETLKYTAAVRAKILRCQGPSTTARDITLLDAYLGELFSHAVVHVCRSAGVSPAEVDLVGSHGQTIYHHPHPEKMPGYAVTGSLQVGNAAVIAERTGITVVSGFRSRDMAAGGQGAPLAPILDYTLYHHASRGRIVVNIGGIANMTTLPAGAEKDGVCAFDTGPGNCLIDTAMEKFTDGRMQCDEDGRWASAGKVDAPLLKRLLDHPFLNEKPPKSLDKETFGHAFLDGLLTDFSDRQPKDLVATLTAFTVKSLTAAIMEFALQTARYEEIIISGGGVHNPVIMEGLRGGFPKLVVSTTDDYGLPGKAKEAVLMAFLANEAVMGTPGNIPSATGAGSPVVLGSITPGRRVLELLRKKK